MTACQQFHNMSATALHMPLHTSPDVPHFCGDANDLPRYLTEVEDLCQSRQQMTGPECIKYAVYYTDKSSWNIWDSAREVLADPASWEDFKSAMQDLYPRYEVVHAHMPLPASLLLPAAVPVLCHQPPPLLSCRLLPSLCHCCLPTPFVSRCCPHRRPLLPHWCLPLSPSSCPCPVPH